MTFSLADGKAIIGMTANNKMTTVPIKVGQSIIFSFFNVDPPLVSIKIETLKIWLSNKLLLIHKIDNI